MPIDRKRILYEDQHLLAVLKLGGELVVKGKGKMQKLPLLDFLRKEYPSLLAIHRLDFETSGVVLFAKSSNVLKKIVDSKFAGWKKVYAALVFGVPRQPKGVVNFKLPSRMDNSPVEARTEYMVREAMGDCSYIELEFERGQRHQIRKHMSMIRHPLLLDTEYGDQKTNWMFQRRLKCVRFFLHAERVEFPHPITGEKVVISAKLPISFVKAIERLRR